MSESHAKYSEVLCHLAGNAGIFYTVCQFLQVFEWLYKFKTKEESITFSIVLSISSANNALAYQNILCQ